MHAGVPLCAKKCGCEFNGTAAEAQLLGWIKGARIDFRGGNGKVECQETGTWTCSDCE